MLMSSNSLSTLQNPIFAPQLSEYSFTSWVVKLVIIVLGEELCDLLLWIKDSWVEGLSLSDSSVAQLASISKEMCCIIKLWDKSDDDATAP